MPNPDDGYLARLLADRRSTIRAAVPEVEVAFRSGVPAFRYRGRPLVSTGAAKGHVALHVMDGDVRAAFENRLRGSGTTATAGRFRTSNPLPEPLVAGLAAARGREIDEKETP